MFRHIFRTASAEERSPYATVLPPKESRIVFTMPLDMASGKFPPRGLVLRAKKWFTDKMSRSNESKVAFLLSERGTSCWRTSEPCPQAEALKVSTTSTLLRSASLERSAKPRKNDALMSAFGPSRHFAAAQQLGRFWREADINWQAKPADSVANDPQATSHPAKYCL